MQAGYTDGDADDIGEFGSLVILFSSYTGGRGKVTSLPWRGRSFAAALTKDVDTDLGERGPLYWDHNGARAVLYDRWKLVTEGPKRIQNGVPVIGSSGWELYDTEEDCSELHDLANRELKKVKELRDLWAARKTSTGPG